jgi:integrase/recombinase XerD
MTARRRRMLEDRQRRGLAPSPQQCDLEAVQHLAQHDRRAPDHMSEEALRQYCRSLLNEKQVAESPFRIHLAGIRFCDACTRQRPWPVFELIHPRHRQKLPVVLSPQAVRSLLALGQRAKARMGLQIISACGLRLREGTPRQVSDIAPQRLLVRGRQGTGGQDRLVPLAARTLELLRVYWPRARPRPWLCPARPQQPPLPATTLQKTVKRVVRRSGLAKDASSHTLRHAYATHLVARGVSWRVLQALRGHKHPRTTARDTPLTTTTFDVVHATSTALRAARSPLWGPGMPEVADVFRCDGLAEQERVGAALRPSHRRALDDLIHGRTEALGGPLVPCEPWGQEHDVDHSGRHRSCPTCQRLDPEAWLADRRPARLPVPSGHAVLTRPHELRALVRRHQNDLYDLVLRAAAPARITLAADPQDVGGLLGVLCVLHTWPRTRV